MRAAFFTGAIIKVTGFNHIGLNAAGKHDETQAFYRDLLGMTEFESSGAATLVNGFWSGVDETFVHVISDPAEGKMALPNNTHLSLFVEDIATAVDEVKNLTDEFVHIGEGSGQIIWFKDPAGNTIELQQQPKQ